MNLRLALAAISFLVAVTIGYSVSNTKNSRDNLPTGADGAGASSATLTGGSYRGETPAVLSRFDSSDYLISCEGRRTNSASIPPSTVSIRRRPDGVILTRETRPSVEGLETEVRRTYARPGLEIEVSEVSQTAEIREFIAELPESLDLRATLSQRLFGLYPPPIFTAGELQRATHSDRSELKGEASWGGRKALKFRVKEETGVYADVLIDAETGLKVGGEVYEPSGELTATMICEAESDPSEWDGLSSEALELSRAKELSGPWYRVQVLEGGQGSADPASTAGAATLVRLAVQQGYYVSRSLSLNSTKMPVTGNMPAFEQQALVHELLREGGSKLVVEMNGDAPKLFQILSHQLTGSSTPGVFVLESGLGPTSDTNGLDE